ncbi:MAG: hypothetical protein QG570_287, partial [Patescibacteria group bacterium]|nr:hypothetical protein [Patescibacteria group bacterium]
PVIPTIDKARIPERTHERSVVVEPQKAPHALHKSTIAEDELESKKELLNALATIEGGYNQDGPIEIFTEQKVNRPILNLPSLGSNNFSLKGEIKLKNTRKFPSIIVAEDIKDIKEQEESLEKKVSELLVLAKKARAQYQIKGGKEPTFNTPIVEDVKGRISQLREEKKKLKIEIDKSTEQVNLIDNTNKSRETLQNQIQMLTHKNEELETLLKKINFELDELKGTPEHKSSNQTESEIKVVPEEAKNEEVFIPSKPTENQVDEFKLKSRPSPNNSYLNNNIIEGLIKDMSGKLVEGAAVIIKDSQGNVIRALKTNQIGQFRTQTSVPNGKYSIEVLKGGMSFDIIRVEAVGRLMNPIYLVAKNSK